ncbi:MAG TPA: orotidine-5'-phosphate decarboxylase [Candidatus Thermoplasmatota archaeon]|nr:orotidine-5'-phosphate decarboxylase [Candidatus Thermoplasmatota archaeon]
MTAAEGFRARLAASAARRRSWLCLGLDPEWGRLSPDLRALGPAEALYRFSRDAIDATADAVSSVKPQSAFFEEHGAEGFDALRRVIAHARSKGLPVILDAKRGDIGNTAKAYARAAFDHLGADAVTVNPYMGRDSVDPFAAYAEKGVFVLCRTSNPAGDALQGLALAEGGRLFERTARLVAEWDARGNLGVVVGATYPDELARVRALLGEDAPILVPGVGAQGGSPADALKGANARGANALVVAARAILYAGAGSPADQKAAAHALRDALASASKGHQA